MRGLVWMVLAGATALSLLICLGLLALFARSFWRCDSLATELAPDLVCWQSYRGGIHYVHVAGDELAQSDAKHPPEGFSSVALTRAQIWQDWNGPTQSSYTVVGFAYATVYQKYTIAAVPYWALVMLAALLPIWWAITPEVQHKPKNSGHCPKCKHDLRGALDRCPSCGYVFGHHAPALPPQPPVLPPRPAKRVRSVVVQAAKQDQNHSRPTDDSGRSA